MVDAAKVIAAAEKMAADTAPPPDHALERIYLIPEFDEEQVALAWLRKNDPEALDPTYERMSTAIDLRTLNQRMILHVLIRRSKLRKPLRSTQPMEAGPDGERLIKHIEAEELIDDVDPGPGVKIGDHWAQTGSRFAAKIIQGSFFQEVAKQAAPWALRYADATGFKDGALPNWLVLRGC